MFAILTNRGNGTRTLYDANGKKIILGVGQSTPKPVHLKDAVFRVLVTDMARPGSILVEEKEGPPPDENDPFAKTAPVQRDDITRVKPIDVLAMYNTPESLKPHDLLRLATEAMPTHQWTKVRPARNEILAALTAAASADKPDDDGDGDAGGDGDDNDQTQT